MGWFSWLWNKRRDLEKLEAEVRRNTTPASLAGLADKYMQAGESNNAVETARRAIERFPESPRVRDMHANIMRLHNQQLLNKLQKELETRPQASTYARLADIYYREMHDLNRSLELAREGLAKFPNFEDLHLINGQIRYVRYAADHLTKDGMHCLEHLEAAVKLNPMNYKANAIMARVYTEVGAYDRALPHLDAILKFAPDDSAARTLQTKLRGLQPLGDDLEDLFKAVEAIGGPADATRALASLFPVEYTKGQAPPGRLDVQTAAANITDFRRVDGAKAAIVMDEQGKVIGSFSASGSSAELAEMVWTLYTTSEDSARRMDIGSFNRGSLESPGVRLHMVEAGRHVIAVATAKSTRDESVRIAMNAYIDTVLKG